MEDKKTKKIEFVIEGKDYEKLNEFKKIHSNCLELYPNMTGGQYCYSFSGDGFGILKTVTCVCGQRVFLDGEYNFELDDEFKLPKGRFQVVPEDKKTKEIIRTIFNMRKRPGMYFGSSENRSFLALKWFLEGYAKGTREKDEEETYWETMQSEVWAEYKKMTEGQAYSDQEQFDIYFEALEMVLKRDYPIFATEIPEVIVAGKVVELEKDEEPKKVLSFDRFVKYFKEHFVQTTIGRLASLI